MSYEYKSPLWGPFLYHSEIEDEFFDFLGQIVDNATVAMNDGLAGKIDKEYLFNQEDTANIMKYLEKHLYRYTWEALNNRTRHDYTQDDLTQQVGFKPMNIWVNKQVAKEYNPVHSHSGDISFVIYQKIPKVIYEEPNKTNGGAPGTVVFTIAGMENPMDNRAEGVYATVANTLKPLTDYACEPEEKDILIFPSYLRHYVEAFYTENVTRITIAGNILLGQKA